MYSAILLIALWLNKTDKKMLILTLIVGMSFFLPVELIQTRPEWFMACIAAESFVLLSALFLKTKATFAIIGICSMLLLSHIITWNYLDIPNYAFIVPYLEYLEIIVCVLCSNTLLNYLKGMLRCQVQKY